MAVTYVRDGRREQARPRARGGDSAAGGRAWDGGQCGGERGAARRRRARERIPAPDARMRVDFRDLKIGPLR